MCQQSFVYPGENKNLLRPWADSLIVIFAERNSNYMTSFMFSSLKFQLYNLQKQTSNSLQQVYIQCGDVPSLVPSDLPVLLQIIWIMSAVPCVRWSGSFSSYICWVEIMGIKCTLLVVYCNFVSLLVSYLLHMALALCQVAKLVFKKKHCWGFFLLLEVKEELFFRLSLFDVSSISGR